METEEHTLVAKQKKAEAFKYDNKTTQKLGILGVQEEEL